MKKGCCVCTGWIQGQLLLFSLRLVSLCGCMCVIVPLPIKNWLISQALERGSCKAQPAQAMAEEEVEACAHLYSMLPPISTGYSGAGDPITLVWEPLRWGKAPQVVSSWASQLDQGQSSGDAPSSMARDIPSPNTPPWMPPMSSCEPVPLTLT